VTQLADAPTHAPAAAAVMARARSENFPVASRLLPRDLREHLLAVYGFARLVDELGDDPRRAPSERLRDLELLEHALEGALDGAEPGTAGPFGELLGPLARTVQTLALPREPLLRLIEANRLDQRATRYESWEQLRGYCALSADPVGELVLAIFGVWSPERVALSDSICTALQLIEHCQDVAEDLAHGRVYLPAEDMRRFGCEEQDLHAARAGEPLRLLIAFELARARRLLKDGAPLIAGLHGRPRLAVAAFSAGGAAAIAAIEQARCDVLAAVPRAGTRQRALAFAATLRASHAAGGPRP